MRIAIDGRALTGRYTGDRTYWRGLINSLPKTDDDMEFVIYTRTPIAEGELKAYPNVRHCVLEASNERTWSMFALPAATRRDKADLLHVQYTTPPRLLCPCPIVTTVHDISFKLFPEWFPRKDRLLLNLGVPASMNQAATVITDSESSRTDIIREYSLPAQRVVAIPLGVSSEYNVQDRPTPEQLEEILGGYGISRPYVLALGVLQPRKNLNLLSEAFGKAHSRLDLKQTLVIAGKIGWQTDQESLRQSARIGGGDAAANAVRFPGYIDDKHLAALYHGAELFAYPSLYEGFGLPPIEAMACGTPVMVSDAPCLPEVVGDAAVVVPARDVESWANALGSLLTNSDASMQYSSKGPKHAAQYSWETTANRTRDVYRAAATK